MVTYTNCYTLRLIPPIKCLLYNLYDEISVFIEKAMLQKTENMDFIQPLVYNDTQRHQHCNHIHHKLKTDTKIHNIKKNLVDAL